jgi:hypothetical protein
MREVMPRRRGVRGDRVEITKVMNMMIGNPVK